MGFYIESDVIYLTKGDDAVLEVVEAVLEPRAVAPVVVVGRCAEGPALIQIDALPGSRRIVFRHEDTAELTVGRYSADVQLTTADGKRYTVWPTITGSGRYVVKNLNNFVIMPEVTAK